MVSVFASRAVYCEFISGETKDYKLYDASLLQYSVIMSKNKVWLAQNQDIVSE